jgi:hypothetical protein
VRRINPKPKTAVQFNVDRHRNHRPGGVWERAEMKSIEYRAYARNGLAMVETVASEEANSSLISMAQRGHRLACETEAERTNVVWAPEPPDCEATNPD